MIPEFQLQHRLPQVYLKPFGYRERGRWYISVLEKSKNFTEQKLISEFTAEENVFDFDILPDIHDRRHFEMLCAKIEAQYPVVLKSIKKGGISSKQHNILCQFMATLIARAKSIREYFEALIRNYQTRTKFLDEICMFNEEARSDLDIIINNHKIDEVLRVVSFIAGEHMAKCIHRLQYIILRSPQGNGKRWFTSDSPVVIDKQNNYAWLIPPESEIYFPISKDYCFFFYHEDSAIQDHPLRKLETGKVHQCDEISHGFIMMKIMQNAFKYLVISLKHEQRFKPESQPNFQLRSPLLSRSNGIPVIPNLSNL